MLIFASGDTVELIVQQFLFSGKHGTCSLFLLFRVNHQTGVFLPLEDSHADIPQCPVMCFLHFYSFLRIEKIFKEVLTGF